MMAVAEAMLELELELELELADWDQGILAMVLGSLAAGRTAPLDGHSQSLLRCMG